MVCQRHSQIQSIEAWEYRPSGLNAFLSWYVLAIKNLEPENFFFGSNTGSLD